MAWTAAASIGASVVGGLFSSDNSGDAARQASEAQAGMTQQAIAEQRRQFDAVQALLKPYVNAGTTALAGQQDLIGANGNPSQQFAIDNIKNGAQFTSMKQVGENAILANGSATGNLRGGNVQGALAQFSPQLLAQLIDSQYQKLGGLAASGQNAAAGTGTAAMTTGANVGQLMGQQGAQMAGGILGAANGANQGINAIVNGVGQVAGRFPGGFGGSAPPSVPQGYNMGDVANIFANV